MLKPRAWMPAYCGISQAQLDAYEALLLDVIEGDHSLFLRYDEVSWAWQVWSTRS